MSLVYPGGPNFNDKYLRRKPCEDEAELGVVQPQPSNTWSHQMLGEARKDPPLEPLESAALQTP